MRILKSWPCKARYRVGSLSLSLGDSPANPHIPDMQSAQEELQKKNQELNDMCRDKTNKLAQMTNLYNLLKTRAMRSRMQTAASDTVSQALTSLNVPVPVSIPLANHLPLVLTSASKFPKTPPFPVNTDGVEQLHRHQRSGTDSSKRAKTKTPSESSMLPPTRPKRPNWDGRNGMYWTLLFGIYN
jgi:E3 ubiquitin-protein ligase CCNP1IP1